MKKTAISLMVYGFVISLCLSCLTGCQVPGESGIGTEMSSSETAERETIAVDASQSETKTQEKVLSNDLTLASEEVFKTSPSWSFEWSPHVFSSVNSSALDAGDEMVFYDWVDAIIAGDESLSCPDEETMYEISSCMDTFFPPYAQLISEYSYSDGKIIMKYVGDASTRSQLISDFVKQVTHLIEIADIKETDSPTVRAIKLYMMYSSIVKYDYSAVDDDVVTDVSSYRGIMERIGICQSFGSAYAYLCLQAGIDATVTSGMTEDYLAHTWTLLTLDGQYYYADPTFENGEGGLGLKYFGMTATQRELCGAFIADDYNIGDTNEIWGRDFNVTDDVFAPLWNCVRVISVEEGPDGIVFVCEAGDGSIFDFLPDGLE